MITSPALKRAATLLVTAFEGTAQLVDAAVRLLSAVSVITRVEHRRPALFIPSVIHGRAAPEPAEQHAILRAADNPCAAACRRRATPSGSVQPRASSAMVWCRRERATAAEPSAATCRNVSTTYARRRRLRPMALGDLGWDSHQMGGVATHRQKDKAG